MPNSDKRSDHCAHHTQNIQRREQFVLEVELNWRKKQNLKRESLEGPAGWLLEWREFGAFVLAIIGRR